jgi:predicted nucleic acid-binding protein
MYLFDTDIISWIVKTPPTDVLVQKINAIPQAAQFISAITVGEIFYGAWRVARRDELIQAYEGHVFPRLTILPYDAESGKIFGRIKSSQEKRGQPRNETDLQIAAIALQHHLTLVTGNVKHFKGIPGLVVENWL